MSDVHFARPEFIRNSVAADIGIIVERPISLWEKVISQNAVRKLFILCVLAAIWELYGLYLHNPLLFPTFSSTVDALSQGVLTGEIPARAWSSVRILLLGYVIGIVLSALLTMISISSTLGADLLETLTSMFSPLPSIAILPLSLIWFGLGNGSMVFVLIHAVLWVTALNTHTGFQSVSRTLRMVGRNYGLTGLGYVCKILIPAAFPSILTGLKVGWAFAWRTLIAAELVFGVSSSSGGLGWYIFEHKNDLDIPSVFAGLLTVILIGLVVENVLFREVEQRTVRRWGMQS